MAEAWCDQDLYVWSWYVRRAGTKIDLNVVSVSLLVPNIVQGAFQVELEEEYKITKEGVKRKRVNFLSDAIYPKWPIFAKAIHHTSLEAENKYKKE